MFLGDIRSSGEPPERVEDYLPPGPDNPHLDAQMLEVLEQGRPGDTSNDLVVSPLTAYIYRCLGLHGCMQALETSKRMVLGQIAPRAFLHSLQPAMLRTIIEACMHIAVSRRSALQQIHALLGD